MAKLNLRYDLQKASQVTGIMLILMMAVIAPFFGGYDYKVAYRADTLNNTFGLNSAFPYPASWLIYPFAVFPEMVGYFLWNIVSALCFIAAIRYWKGNYLTFALFLGTFWIFYGGQIEGFMAGALVLLTLPNPWLAGLGITILSFKPQIGFLPIIYLSITKKDWKILVVPAFVYFASFLKWGWWIPVWLSKLQGVKYTSTAMTSMVSIFPYGLILLPLLWRYKSSLKIWMYVQSLIIPYYPIYSLTPIFTMPTPPMWVNIPIWLFYLLLSKNIALSKFGFIIPLALLSYELVKIERVNRSNVPSVVVSD